MSSKSRKVVEAGDEQQNDLESQQRLRAEFARSSTTLRRAPHPSADTIDAIQASLEAAFAELDQLEQPRRMPPPLPKMPPPLPRAQPASFVEMKPVTVAAAPPRRSTWRRWLVGALLLMAASGVALRMAVPEHPAWRALERLPAALH